MKKDRFTVFFLNRQGRTLPARHGLALLSEAFGEGRDEGGNLKKGSTHLTEF